MKFKIQPIYSLNKFYIVLDYVWNACCSDKDIVAILRKYININIDEYTAILKSYNATLLYNEYYFNNYEDVQKAVEYLNEKYIIFINLME